MALNMSCSHSMLLSLCRLFPVNKKERKINCFTFYNKSKEILTNGHNCLNPIACDTTENQVVT